MESTASAHLKDLKFLLVDDSRTMVAILRSALRSYEAKDFYEATDVVRAVAILCQYDIDVVLLDILMPNIDGLKLLRWIRSSENLKNCGVPVIIISGVANKKNFMKSINAGADYFVTKPVSSDVLYNRVQKVLLAPIPRILASNYYGPDRRRVVLPDYTGIEKREVENELIKDDGPA